MYLCKTRGKKLSKILSQRKKKIPPDSISKPLHCATTHFLLLHFTSGGRIHLKVLVNTPAVAAMKDNGYVTIQLALGMEDKGTDHIPSADQFLPLGYFIVQIMMGDATAVLQGKLAL